MLHGPGFDNQPSERERVPRRNDVSDGERPRRHRVPSLGTGVHATCRSSLQPGGMVIVCVRNQDRDGMETSGAPQPVFAAVDQHSTAAAVDDDGGMPSMKTSARLNVPACTEECQTHDQPILVNCLVRIRTAGSGERRCCRCCRAVGASAAGHSRRDRL